MKIDKEVSRRSALTGLAGIAAGIALSTWGQGAGSAAQAAEALTHPRIYTGNEDLAGFKEKLSQSAWAAASFNALKATIDPLADRHQSDPQWILSRMGMFWKSGEHFTQVYIKGQRFDRGEGNAPVPTVRYPAMRTWNANKNGPLEDRIPYSEDGSMMNQNGQVVPYAETGHMVRLNNEEILAIAQKAAFLHWATGLEKYAKFAGDIYWQWVMGVYYMNPALDPQKSLGGPGGYEPGGIGGYYDYEVIHDPMGGLAAVVYDFLHGWLDEHPHPHAVEIGKSVTEISNTVFKRFIEIGMVRGSATGNWNVNGWSCILPAILALEPNSYYPDGKGREHYLNYYTTESTQYHQALPDILKEYDPVTGLWHESPAYSFGTIQTLLDFSVPVARAGTDTIAGNSTMNRASLAIVPWLDARGNMVVFGDARGGAPGYAAFERLLTYYTKVGDQRNAALVSNVLKNAIEAGQYSRNALGFIDILSGADLATGTSAAEETRTAYSPHHRHITMKNRNDAATGLMATLYGGWNSTDHLNPNGLALQFYGKGWSLAPNAKAYESYWSDDYAYHSGPCATNTILPGYRQGPIVVNGLEPEVPSDSFTNGKALSPYVSFADVNAAEKRRVVAIVRTSETTGYYVDIFRSDQSDNDYIHHNLGHSLTVSDPREQPIALAAKDLGAGYDRGYTFFKNVKGATYSGDLRAQWTVSASPASPSIVTDMWMTGQQGRTLFAVDAPPTTILTTVTPGVNIAPQATPTLIVRQTGNNASTAPFAAVFEAYEAGAKSLEKVEALQASGNFVGLRVASTGSTRDLQGRVEHILNATDLAAYSPTGELDFTGTFGVAAEDSGGFRYLYLGLGKDLRNGSYRITAVADTSVAASLHRDEDGKLRFSATAPVLVTLPFEPSGYKGNPHSTRILYSTSSGEFPADGMVDMSRRTVTGRIPAGWDVPLRIDLAS